MSFISVQFKGPDTTKPPCRSLLRPLQKRLADLCPSYVPEAAACPNPARQLDNIGGTQIHIDPLVSLSNCSHYFIQKRESFVFVDCYSRVDSMSHGNGILGPELFSPMVDEETKEPE
ncbi:7326_t:CDS:2 [Acaulospora colombiana]|uniref:7326_t:CDS:1 n=1 Tax=Acaulospora colombiana TaxID=27376 RepID=A0ACA9NC16_9GLOM|nr:7326_t:CDS:2 [Acaulospora colombiana]